MNPSASIPPKRITSPRFESYAIPAALRGDGPATSTFLHAAPSNSHVSPRRGGLVPQGALRRCIVRMMSLSSGLPLIYLGELCVTISFTTSLRIPPREPLEHRPPGQQSRCLQQTTSSNGQADAITGAARVSVLYDMPSICAIDHRAADTTKTLEDRNDEWWWRGRDRRRGAILVSHHRHEYLSRARCTLWVKDHYSSRGF